MGISLFISWGKAQGGVNVPAVAFVLGLAAISVLVHRFGKVWRPRFPVRTWNAVWSSSILFAAFHSSVWPSPIPLFVLALGLGVVTARTRSWWPAAFAHALFNTVSTVVVGLRG
jgi:membrane protease YdiL (CAAX protease family)